MTSSRLEAFSDGVMAIIITIMVLEIKVPHGTELSALRPLLPALGSYILSFVYVGIYWSNHHHLMHLTDRISGKTLVANLHLLFWMSLIPFASGWLGENDLAASTAALYGFVLLMAAVAWIILQSVLVSTENENNRLKEAIGTDWKGRLTLGLYLVGIGLAFVRPWAAIAIYIFVAAIWVIPDRRFEHAMRSDIE